VSNPPTQYVPPIDEKMALAQIAASIRELRADLHAIRSELHAIAAHTQTISSRVGNR